MKRSIILVISVLIVSAVIGAGYVAWRYSNSPHIRVQLGTATEVTAQLQRLPNNGYFYIETPDHRGDHSLRIVNSLDPIVTNRLEAKLGKKVHLFGIRDGDTSDDLAVLWIDGNTIQAETDAIVAFNNVSFREIYNHASLAVQTCITDKLGAAVVADFVQNRAQVPTDQQSSDLTACFQAH